MARYYEENALIEFIKQHTPTINGETTMECVERAIREAPTADAVPRSEVEKIFEDIEEIIKAPLTVGFCLTSPLKQALNEYNKGIRKEKLYYINKLKKEHLATDINDGGKYTESEGKT